MKEGAAFRGQPLLLLVGLLVGWTMLRAAMWQPSGLAPAFDELAAADLRTPKRAAFVPPAVASGLPAPVARWLARRAGSRPVPASPHLATTPQPQALSLAIVPLEPRPALVQASMPAPTLLPPVQSPPQRASRWSAAGWLLLRRDTTTPFLSGRPSYGRSQAGAVIGFALAPASGHRPQVHLRASTALAGEREQEAAVGLSARPLAWVPVRVAAEARVSETDHGTRLRPAAYAVTELAPFALPLGSRAEIYAQGGYVGGDFATAFVDGQAHVERPLVRLDGAEFSVGAAAWGGAQRGAARLDVGPSAAVSFHLGKAYGRVAADYRFRVAGDAQPASGPALTVSAGF